MNYEDDDTDFGIGDSMDGCGNGPVVKKERMPSIGILHAIYPRHKVVCCAQCGKRIRESEMMYSRDDQMYFCDMSHEKQYQRATGGN